MPSNSSATVVPLLLLPAPEPRPVDVVESQVPRRRQGRLHVSRRAILAGISALALLTSAAAGGLYLDYSRRFVSTDDAFIAARQFAVAPKVAGYITAVPVTDNQHVAAGDVIARIDDRDYRVALAQTEAQVAVAEAGVTNVSAQIEVAQAQITANEALVKQAEARLVYARQEAERYGTLAKEGWSSRQTGDLTIAELAQQQAALASAQANVVVAQRQLDALEAQRSSALASLRQAQDQRDQARLNLSSTTVTAAQPGRIVQLGAAIGQFAQAGSSLTMFVPDEIWVTANFKETQLDLVASGTAGPLRDRRLSGASDQRPRRQRAVRIRHGVLAAAGENATGNYVKIVQRVPVKIVIDNAPTDVTLGPGMSVLPTVRTDAEPSLFERLGDWL